jgi:hypothetical protein
MRTHDSGDPLPFGAFTPDEHRLARRWAAAAGWRVAVDRVADSEAERLWLTQPQSGAPAVYTIVRLPQGFMTARVSGALELAVHCELRAALVALAGRQPDRWQQRVAVGGPSATPTRHLLELPLQCQQCGGREFRVTVSGRWPRER